MPGVVRDVIAAIATPPGKGALATVRVSGDGAIDLATRVFRGKRELTQVASHSIVHGYIHNDSGVVVDEVLAGIMRAPHTYTGEDSVELSCHGGHVAARGVLDVLLKAGARAAEPGEFTRRAFLNGKLDLAQAEAIAQVVSAKSKRALQASVRLLEGRLSEPVRELRETLLNCLSEIEARLDFDDDLGEIDRESLRRKMDESAGETRLLLRRTTAGKLIAEGARVAIVGKANVGKSSIFNRIVGIERSIVSSSPGTTRDYIEESIEHEGMVLTFVDGAGFFGSGDAVELEGERRARKVLQESDAVLLVFDVSSELEKEDFAFAEFVQGKKAVVAANKADMARSWEPGLEGVSLVGVRPILTSAVTGEGIEELVSSLYRELAQGSVGSSEEIAATDRQVRTLHTAHESLEAAARLLKEGMSDELIAYELRSAADSLGEITGESIAPEVLDRIFSSFCVGK